jgi:hypothetical protein
MQDFIVTACAATTPWGVPTSSSPRWRTEAGSLLDFDRRLKAVGEFATLPEAERLPTQRIRSIPESRGGAHRDRSALFCEPPSANSPTQWMPRSPTPTMRWRRDYVAVLGRPRLRPQVDVLRRGDGQRRRPGRAQQPCQPCWGSVIARQHRRDRAAVDLTAARYLGVVRDAHAGTVG